MSEPTVQEVVKAIGQLNTSDPTNWTKAGLPQPAKLSKILGVNITGALRDEAWTQYQAETDTTPTEDLVDPQSEPDAIKGGENAEEEQDSEEQTDSEEEAENQEVEEEKVQGPMKKGDFHECKPVQDFGTKHRVWQHKKTGEKYFEPAYAKEHGKKRYPFI